MQRSEQIGQLAAALALAQAKFRAIGKDKTAKIQSQKGSFSYTYADLATVVEATRLALSEQGLSVLQPVRMADGQIIVTSVLAHKSGEWLSEEMAWPVASADNRSIGSGITYARRHAYLALVGGAATDEDDDAEQARGGSHETARPSNGAAAAESIRAAAHDPASRKAACFAKLARLGVEGRDLRAFVGKSVGRTMPGDGAILLKSEEELSALEAATEKAEQDHNAAEALAKAQNRSVA